MEMAMVNAFILYRKSMK